jgi:hypothetical protein
MVSGHEWRKACRPAAGTKAQVWTSRIFWLLGEDLGYRWRQVKDSRTPSNVGRQMMKLLRHFRISVTIGCKRFP